MLAPGEFEAQPNVLALPMGTTPAMWLQNLSWGAHPAQPGQRPCPANLTLHPPSPPNLWAMRVISSQKQAAIFGKRNQDMCGHNVFVLAAPDQTLDSAGSFDIPTTL